VGGKSYRGRGGGGIRFLCFIFLLLFLAATVTAGYLYYTNRRMTGEVVKLRKEKNQADGDMAKLRSQLKQKEDEIAELRIQAVIRNPLTPGVNR